METRFLLILLVVGWVQSQVAERDALDALYKATLGTSWVNADGWRSFESLKPICDRFGITCNSDKEVQTIHLPHNNLLGNIPSALNALKSLVVLDLSGNRIYGSLPAAIFSMTSLTTINLGQNNISGTIPPLSSTLSNLALGDNSLVGKLPQLPSPMSALDVSRNQLTGELFGTSFGAPALITLLAPDNRFTGGLSGVVGAPSLSVLDVSNNSLCGPIDAISQVNTQELSSINLARNRFNGTINTLWNLTLLASVTLSDNLFTGTLGMGPVFNDELHVFLADGNRFEGVTPQWLACASVECDLSGNPKLLCQKTCFYNPCHVDACSACGAHACASNDDCTGGGACSYCAESNITDNVDAFLNGPSDVRLGKAPAPRFCTYAPPTPPPTPAPASATPMASPAQTPAKVATNKDWETIAIAVGCGGGLFLILVLLGVWRIRRDFGKDDRVTNPIYGAINKPPGEGEVKWETIADVTI